MRLTAERTQCFGRDLSPGRSLIQGDFLGGGVEDRIKGIDEKIDGNILNDTASER